MFKKRIYSRQEIIEAELKNLKKNGIEVIERKGKDFGTRLWFILKKGRRQFIALLSINSADPDEGWTSTWFHEDHGIPRLNCPKTIFKAIKHKARTKKGRLWRKTALEKMDEFSKLNKIAKRIRKHNPERCLKDIRQQLRYSMSDHQKAYNH